MSLGALHFKLRRDIKALRTVTAGLRSSAKRGTVVPVPVDEVLLLVDGVDRILNQAAMIADALATGKEVA